MKIEDRCGKGVEWLEARRKNLLFDDVFVAQVARMQADNGTALKQYLPFGFYWKYRVK